MMTKSAMEKNLRDMVDTLSILIDPDDFAAAAKDFIETMRSVPQEEINVRDFEIIISIREKQLSWKVDDLRRKSERRKISPPNEKLTKPSLSIHDTKAMLNGIKLVLRFSTLPDHYMPPPS